MRRYWPILFFLIVLVTPFILRLALGISTSISPPGGAKQLIIVTPHNEGIRREFGDAFTAWYKKTTGTDVYVDYRTYGGGSDIVKYFVDASESTFPKLHTYQVDLVWGGGDYLFDQQLKKPGFLQGVTLDPAIMKAAYPSPTLNGLALYDLHSTPPQWFGTALSSFGITYNRDVLRYLKLPDPLTWADLKAPAYNSWIVAADPTRSASAKQAFKTFVEKAMVDAAHAGSTEDAGWAKGMGLIRQMSANTKIFMDGSGLVPGIIASGDAAAGMTIDFYGRSEVEAVGADRLGYVQPKGATVINPDPIAMARGAEHAEVAKAFIEFVLSRQGQMIWDTRHGAPGGPRTTNLRRLPIMPSVYDDNADFVDKENPFTESGGFNKSDAREKTFGILGELIQASCMNCLEDLRDTRRIILASPHAAELDAKLGTFPYDQKHALELGKQYKAADPVKQLEMERQWTAEFREEYRKLREEASK